jgi:hypothetical protein
MTKYEMDNMKGWDTDQLDMQPFDTDTVYERYGFMPESEFMRLQGKTGGDPNKVIDTLGIYILKRTMKDNKLEISGAALFIEKIDRTKMLWESRWEHVEGRMMGRGEVEKQVEAQVARNYHINTRRKQSLWSGKKVFASNTDEVPKNLVKDVKNGQVLKLGANGQITQVDMTTKSLAEIGNDEQIWEQNSNQRAFTFEVATGEALPSGTAFRLGVILTNAVESYFGLKREEFGFFIKDIVEEAVLPIFESQNKKHALLMSAGEDGFDELREVLVGIEKNKIMKNLILKNSAIPDPVVIEQIVRLRVEGKTELMLKIREDLYKNKEFKFDVVTTGEQLDVNSKIETYKTVFQILAGNPAAMNDPRIMRLLEKIVGLTGESLRAMLGTLKPLPQQRPETPATEGSVPQPDASNNKTSLNDLANVNAPDKTASKI